MTDSITFIDKALNDVVQKSAFKFSSFQKYLEETSTDLKNLEKWLQNCAICIPVFVETDDEDIKVGWDNKGGTWRLLAEFTVSDDEGQWRDSRPVIEMPIRSRLLCRRFLPVLIKEISDLLPDEVSEAQPENDLDIFGVFKDEEPIDLLSDITEPVPSKKLAKASVKAKPAADSDDLDAIFASDDEIPF